MRGSPQLWDRGQDVSEPLNRVSAITMFIEDIERSKAFYEPAFGVSAVPDGHIWEVAAKI